MAWRHPFAVRIQQKPGQQARLFCGCTFFKCDTIAIEDGLSRVTKILCDNRYVLTPRGLVIEDDLTAIEAVL